MQTNNITARLLGRQLVEPDRVAYVFGNTEITFGQLHDRAFRTAQYLKELGAKPQQNVLFVLDDCPEWPVFFHAMILLGCVAVIVDTKATVETLEEVIQNSKSEFVIGNLDFDSVMFASFNCCVSPEDVDYMQCEKLAEPYSFTETDAIFMITTSGTTGLPKLIVHKHQHLEETFSHPSPYGLVKDSVAALTFKFTTSFGVIISMLGLATTGMKSIILSLPFDIKNIPKLIKQHQITHLMITPSVVKFLMKNFEGPLESCLTTIYATGEALPFSSIVQFKEKFNRDLLDCYGCGEIRTWAVLACSLTNNKPGSLGSIGPAATLQIIRDDGNECDVNEIGQLLIKHSNAAMGYYNTPELTAAKFINGWYHTGDFMYKDPDGFYFHVGREEQLIKVNGNYISCIDIENKISRLPGILDCVVVFEKNRLVQDKPLIFVHTGTDTNYNKQEINEYVVNDLNLKSCNPGNIFFIKDLPLSLTNKKTRSVEALYQNVIEL